VLLIISLKFFVFFTEPLNSARRIYQFLFPGKEGMALGTNFDFDVLLGGPCLKGCPAGAFDGGFLVLGMNVLFH
jgi:hypothetical protein